MVAMGFALLAKVEVTIVNCFGIVKYRLQVTGIHHVVCDMFTHLKYSCISNVFISKRDKSKENIFSPSRSVLFNNRSICQLKSQHGNQK